MKFYFSSLNLFCNWRHLLWEERFGNECYETPNSQWNDFNCTLFTKFSLLERDKVWTIVLRETIKRYLKKNFQLTLNDVAKVCNGVKVFHRVLIRYSFMGCLFFIPQQAVWKAIFRIETLCRIYWFIHLMKHTMNMHSLNIHYS